MAERRVNMKKMVRVGSARVKVAGRWARLGKVKVENDEKKVDDDGMNLEQ